MAILALNVGQMLLSNDNLNSFFSKELSVLRCDPTAKAYIVGVLSDFKTSKIDYSKESITSVYSDASFSNNFVKFQSIADWLFLCLSLYPEHLNKASMDYYYTVGRMSYFKCYKLLNKQWIVFEYLADTLIPLTNDIRNIIK